MKYGYFDNEHKEYVITNPMTPTPWINYIGNGKFGGIISATGGGLSFDSDPLGRRILRYKYYNLPSDRPGRYLYLRDEETGEYWSATWQPVMKENQDFECRHGLGYTKIRGQYNDIQSELTYFVPLGKRYELWLGKLKNTGETTRKIKLFSYVEFSWHDAKYDSASHWPCMAFRADFETNKIVVDTMAEQINGTPMYDYISTDLPIVGYDCSQREFIGLYRSESNPIVVENGTCFNTSMYSDNCVGVLCSEVILKPGEEIECRYTLGATDCRDSVDEQIADALYLQNGLEELCAFWGAYCDNLVVETPCEDMNTMINIWNAYQAKTTFDWARFISIYHKGTSGLGYRDNVQDLLGVMHAQPGQVKDRLKMLLAAQFQDGSARKSINPVTKVATGSGRSDDHLWLAFSACNYIRETGDVDFLQEMVTFDDGGEATVAEHLKRTVTFTMNHLGKHGIPDMLAGDWDDSLSHINKTGEGRAESVFVFFQLGQSAYELEKLFAFAGMEENSKEMQKVFDYCKSKLDVVWDGEWYLRAFAPNGEKFCTNEDEYNKIHLIPQAWSVLSHLSDKNRANQAMDNVLKYLYTDKGLITHYPASEDYRPEKKSYYLFPAGSRENGGIFFHSNTWPIIAFTMLGRADDAFKCYTNMLPTRRNDTADLHLTEPYVYSQTMNAPPHKRPWATFTSWLTGTASWTYLTATQYILGIRPEYEGMLIDPQIPSDWNGFKMTRKCRDHIYHIEVCKGTEKGLFVNGKKLKGNIVPWNIVGTVHVRLVL